jgi:hypothetical protein
MRWGMNGRESVGGEGMGGCWDWEVSAGTMVVDWKGDGDGIGGCRMQGCGITSYTIPYSTGRWHVLE